MSVLATAVRAWCSYMCTRSNNRTSFLVAYYLPIAIIIQHGVALKLCRVWCVLCSTASTVKQEAAVLWKQWCYKLKQLVGSSNQKWLTALVVWRRGIVKTNYLSRNFPKINTNRTGKYWCSSIRELLLKMWISWSSCRGDRLFQSVWWTSNENNSDKLGLILRRVEKLRYLSELSGNSTVDCRNTFEMASKPHALASQSSRGICKRLMDRPILICTKDGLERSKVTLFEWTEWW